MLLSSVYVLVRLLLGLLLLRSRRAAAQEVELLVLRHEVGVLRRTAGRPRWRVVAAAVGPHQAFLDQPRPGA